MTCKDCIHYNTCVIVEHRVDENEDHLSEFGCEDFINKNDVVEVVRCKDCEYWQDNNNGYPHEECRWGKDETPDTDDYCSYGKKVE